MQAILATDKWDAQRAAQEHAITDYLVVTPRTRDAARGYDLLGALVTRDLRATPGYHQVMAAVAPALVKSGQVFTMEARA